MRNFSCGMTEVTFCHCPPTAVARMWTLAGGRASGSGSRHLLLLRIAAYPQSFSSSLPLPWLCRRRLCRCSLSLLSLSLPELLSSLLELLLLLLELLLSSLLLSAVNSKEGLQAYKNRFESQLPSQRGGKQVRQAGKATAERGAGWGPHRCASASSCGASCDASCASCAPAGRHQPGNIGLQATARTAGPTSTARGCCTQTRWPPPRRPLPPHLLLLLLLAPLFLVLLVLLVALLARFSALLSRSPKGAACGAGSAGSRQGGKRGRLLSTVHTCWAATVAPMS